MKYPEKNLDKKKIIFEDICTKPAGNTFKVYVAYEKQNK